MSEHGISLRVSISPHLPVSRICVLYTLNQFGNQPGAKIEAKVKTAK